MYKAVFKISKMDCPCEENLIRLRLQSIDNIIDQDYDLANRTLTLVHSNDIGRIESAIAELNLDSTLLENVETDYAPQKHENRKQRKALWAVLIINFAFFVIEMTTGIISYSMGLLADSLDMLADALVYTLSLLAVGVAVSRKEKVALISGYLDNPHEIAPLRPLQKTLSAEANCPPARQREKTPLADGS